jgi:hypothetical protein
VKLCVIVGYKRTCIPHMLGSLQVVRDRCANGTVLFSRCKVIA